MNFNQIEFDILWSFASETISAQKNIVSPPEIRHVDWSLFLGERVFLLSLNQGHRSVSATRQSQIKIIIFANDFIMLQIHWFAMVWNSYLEIFEWKFKICSDKFMMFTFPFGITKAFSYHTLYQIEWKWKPSLSFKIFSYVQIYHEVTHDDYFLCFLLPVIVLCIFFFSETPSSGIFFGAAILLAPLGITRGCTMRPARNRMSGTEVAFTTLEAFHSAK